MKVFCLTIVILLSLSTYAQVVNIESLRMHTDEDRFVLENNLNFSFNNDNGTAIFTFGNNLGTQFKSKDLNKIYFVLADYRVTRSEDQDFQNKWFVHLRFNYKLTKLLNSSAFRVEAFFQSQYNELSDVTSRNLGGAGLRFKIISNDNAEHNNQVKYFQWKKAKSYMNLYVGLAYMYEEERNDAADINFNNHRASSYLSFTFVSANELIKIFNTLYYQPILRDLKNYRISEQLQFKVKISNTLSANFNFTYVINSETPLDRREESSSLSFGFGITL